MRILLVSTYELGHQPVHLAMPAASLRAAGHDVRTLDLAVEPFDDGAIAWADAVAFSVPMHTAFRLALEAARTVRARAPETPICLYGLYARVDEASTLGAVADRLIAGEYEAELVAWAEELPRGATTSRARIRLPVPDRSGLPGLGHYARLQDGNQRRLVGQVQASRGCRHRCRHCPVPTVYDGRFRIVPGRVVLADIEQLVAMGAEHISFGDPDFLNGPAHSLRIVRAMRDRFGIGFDVTTKVELILRHAGIWEELAASGLRFVVSAFETTNDRILRLLRKGHTVAGAARAVRLLRRFDIPVRPTWLPFTPWSTPMDLVDIVGFLDEHHLDVDPIQLTIRLLVPDGSLLLDEPELHPHLTGRTDGGWQWRAADPAMDELATRLSAIVAAGIGAPPGEVLARLRDEIFAAAEKEPPPPVATGGGPRLTEPWFC